MFTIFRSVASFGLGLGTIVSVRTTPHMDLKMLTR